MELGKEFGLLYILRHVMQKHKFHPLGSISMNTTRNVTTASTFHPVKSNAIHIDTNVSSPQNESKRVDQVAEKMISNASSYQFAATSSTLTYVEPSPTLALAAMNPDDSSTHLAIKTADGQEWVESTNMLSDSESDGFLMKRYSLKNLTKMNNDQLEQLLQTMSSKTSIKSSPKPLMELSSDQVSQPIRQTPSKTGRVVSSKPLTALSNDQLLDLLESISSMSASTLKPKT